MKVIYMSDAGDVLRECEFSDAEIKAAHFIVEDFPAWHEQAGRAKCLAVMDRVIEESGAGSQFTDPAQKEEIIKGLSLETALQKAAKHMEDIRNARNLSGLESNPA